MCSELTPRARIPDTRIPQLMQSLSTRAYALTLKAKCFHQRLRSKVSVLRSRLDVRDLGRKSVAYLMTQIFVISVSVQLYKCTHFHFINVHAYYICCDVFIWSVNIGSSFIWSFIFIRSVTRNTNFVVLQYLIILTFNLLLSSFPLSLSACLLTPLFCLTVLFISVLYWAAVDWTGLWS